MLGGLFVKQPSSVLYVVYRMGVELAILGTAPGLLVVFVMSSNVTNALIEFEK